MNRLWTLSTILIFVIFVSVVVFPIPHYSSREHFLNTQDNCSIQTQQTPILLASKKVGGKDVLDKSKTVLQGSFLEKCGGCTFSTDPKDATKLVMTCSCKNKAGQCKDNQRLVAPFHSINVNDEGGLVLDTK